MVLTIQMPNQRKARAYTFHNRVVNDRRQMQVQRISDSEVMDGVTSANVDMLSRDPNALLTDFSLSFKRDIILCKYNFQCQ